MTASAETKVAGSRAGLILSKLQVPTPRPGLVRRAALLHRLLDPAGPPLVSVVAPGGYGKTTLLAQWAEECSRTFAWVTVDRDDNDTVLLVREIDAALRAAGALRSVAPRRDPRSVGTVVQRLRADVSAADEPFVLVLDDAHELTSLDVRDFLSALVRSLPAGSQLVLSGRAEIADVVAAARAERQVLELGLTDVALDADESYALLSGLDAPFEGDVADACVRRAEGWAAGLYLLALTRVDAAPDGPAVNRYVSDYLWAQHLATLPEEHLRFLVRTSVLDRLCGPLCDAVLGTEGSAALLPVIETSSPFLIPLDDGGEWHRYHDLFRDVLLAELTRMDPAAAREGRQRAADWCFANGLPESAMSYARAAEDEDRMAQIVVAAGIPLYRSGQLATIEGWLDVLDDGALLGRHPELAAVGAIAQALLERPFHAERWLDVASRTRATAPPPDGSESLGPWLAVSEAFVCRRGPERMLEDAEAALAGLAPFSPLRPPALMLRLMALRLLGRPDVEAVAADASAGAEAAGGKFAAAVADCQLLLLALERGDVEAAEAARQRFAFAIEDGTYADYKSIALPLVATARLRLAQGAPEEARRLLAAAQQIRPLLTYAIPYINLQVLVEMASAYLELGDTGAARAIVYDADEILRHRPRLGVLRDELEAVRRRASTVSASGSGWEYSLTVAELRLLPLLRTHLAFREIGERLFVSRNTVKTQAISIYRKLGVSSRGEAVERAAELGLIDADPASVR